MQVQTRTQDSQTIYDFINSLSGTCLNTESNDTCTVCNEPVGDFNNNLSEEEYNISGMCQKCQDAMFDTDKPFDEFDYDEALEDEYDEEDE